MSHRARTLLRDHQGAVTIEALGLIGVMLAAFLMFVFVGASYWNVTLLNSTAQSVSLAEQSTMDRYCAVNVTVRCGEAQDRARAVTDTILADAENSLIMLGDAPDCSGVTYGRICNEGTIRSAASTRTSSGALPDAAGNYNQPAMPGGWSWSYANLKTNFSPLGGSAFPVRAASLTLSYKDPNR